MGWIARFRTSRSPLSSSSWPCPICGASAAVGTFFTPCGSQAHQNLKALPIMLVCFQSQSCVRGFLRGLTSTLRPPLTLSTDGCDSQMVLASRAQKMIEEKLPAAGVDSFGSAKTVWNSHQSPRYIMQLNFPPLKDQLFV